MQLSLALQLSTVVSFVFFLVPHASAAPPLIAQYWPAYSSQTPSQINWNMTDLAYYFVTVTNSTGFQVPAGQSLSDITQFVTEAHAHNSKASLVVGGWTGSLHFSTLLATPGGRTSLASQVQSFLGQYQFDGVDLDWEYPTQQGIGCNNFSTSDSANLLSFLKELRSTLGNSTLITAAVSPTGFVGPDGNPLTDLSAYAEPLDYINLMAYDTSGPWSAQTGPNAPLATCLSSTSAIAAVNLWTSAGFPASKILLGIPSYGHSFTTQSSSLALTVIDGFQSYLYQSKTSVTPMGDANDSDAAQTDVCGVTTSGFSGQWQYATLISQGLLSADGQTGLNGYERHWDFCTSTPFLFNQANRIMIAYEDGSSAAAKAAYAVSRGLAGVMIFDSTGFNDDAYSNIHANILSAASNSNTSTVSASSTPIVSQSSSTSVATAIPSASTTTSSATSTTSTTITSTTSLSSTTSTTTSPSPLSLASTTLTINPTSSRTPAAVAKLSPAKATASPAVQKALAMIDSAVSGYGPFPERRMIRRSNRLNKINY